MSLKWQRWLANLAKFNIEPCTNASFYCEACEVVRRGTSLKLAPFIDSN
jgi:hypothetical protein